MKGYFGKLRGVVFDNNDPKKMLRIKAIVPAISNEPLNWALPCKDYLGKDCGGIKLPGKKDGVWIEFEGGDTNYPIHVGMWASKNDIPSDFISSYFEKTTLWKDKNGNKILITANALTMGLKKLLKINYGTNGIARKNDKIKSTAGDDSAYWTFMSALVTIFNAHVHSGVTTGPGVSGPPGTPLGSAPSKLEGKIIEASDLIKLGDL